MNRSVFITGGTGFVGKAMLTRLVRDKTYSKIFVLTRESAAKSADQRISGLIDEIFGMSLAAEARRKIVPVAGDLTKARLGIADEGRRQLALEVTQILHVGASTEFGAPLREAREQNLWGTSHVLDFAMECSATGLDRFDYVSTAYVAGTKPGVVDEGTLDRGQSFANTYEQSKYEAEGLVRSYANRLPIAVYRPSIIVGDSRHGYTPHFKVLYLPLRILGKEYLPFVAINADGYLDVVPVDYVADGLHALMSTGESLGGTHYLTAGLGGEVKIKEFLKDAYEFMGYEQKPMLPFWVFQVIKNTPISKLYDDRFWDTAAMAEPYFCYLRGPKVRFDNRKTVALLARFGVSAPSWNDYKQEIFSFCRASRFGKSVPMPAYQYYLPQSEQLKEA